MASWKKKSQYIPESDLNEFEHQQLVHDRKTRKKRNILRFIIWISCFVLTAALLLIAGIYYADNWLQTGYIHNVSIGNISLSGLTVSEATALLDAHKDTLLPKNDLIVRILDKTLVLTYLDTKARLETSAIANSAYLHGRNNNRDGDDLLVLDPLDFVSIDASSVRALLKAFVQPFNGRPIETSATLVGERPDFTQEPTAEETNQILTITVGSSKYLCDPETIFRTLQTAHRTRTFVIVGETKLMEPDPPSAAMIFHEFCVYPVNAAIDPDTGILTESSVGYGFIIRDVQKLLDEAEEGEVITVPLMRLEPSITTDMLIGTKP